MEPTKKYKLTPNDSWKEVKGFPYRNPKNAYMWGAVHALAIISVLLTGLLYILL